MRGCGERGLRFSSQHRLPTLINQFQIVNREKIYFFFQLCTLQEEQKVSDVITSILSLSRPFNFSLFSPVHLSQGFRVWNGWRNV